jgi:hypothetical protein
MMKFTHDEMRQALGFSRLYAVTNAGAGRCANRGPRPTALIFAPTNASAAARAAVPNDGHDGRQSRRRHTGLRNASVPTAIQQSDDNGYVFRGARDPDDPASVPHHQRPATAFDRSSSIAMPTPHFTAKASKVAIRTAPG